MSCLPLLFIPLFIFSTFLQKSSFCVCTILLQSEPKGPVLFFWCLLRPCFFGPNSGNSEYLNYTASVHSSITPRWRDNLSYWNFMFHVYHVYVTSPTVPFHLKCHPQIRTHRATSYTGLIRPLPKGGLLWFHHVLFLLFLLFLLLHLDLSVGLVVPKIYHFKL